MVNLNSIPTSNTLDYRIALANAGLIVATLDPGESAVLTIAFDQIQCVNPGHQPVVRNQNPVVLVTVSPGNIAYFEGNPLRLKYAQPGGAETAVSFT